MSSLMLQMKSCVGFSGDVLDALKYSSDGRFAIYPVGSYIAIKNLSTDRLSFLDGHTDNVTCVAMSHDGNILATGQKCISGVKADVIMWDLTGAYKLCDAGKDLIGDSCRIRTLKQHIARVQDISFSQFDDYMATLGGQDDNAVVVWRVDNGEAVCGAPAATDSAKCVRWLNGRNDRFVTAGTFHLRVWQVDFQLPKLHPMDAKFGQIRRTILSMVIEEDDHFCYCGTETGDVLKLKIDRNEFKSYNDPDTLIPSMAGISKERFSQAVLCIKTVVNPATGNYNIVAGAGDGTLVYLNQTLKTVSDKRLSLLGGVTSIVSHPSGRKFMVGTMQSNTYDVGLDFQSCIMINSCHTNPVNQVCFPEGTSDLCITASTGDIRVWATSTGKELLRIAVPNLECHACEVTPSGSSIISGWSDGKIRAFYPETGKIRFVIPDAHTGACMSLAIADDDSRGPYRLVTGGAEGRVRIWNCTPQHQAMVASLKEHRGPVYCIRVAPSGDTCVSASHDGSCIMWDLKRYVRTMAFFEPNVFKAVVYHPDESQLLTCGTNHKITYWDAVDGTAIREIDGGDDFMNCVDIDPSGEFYVTGSDDKLLKIWHYDEGLAVAVGKGHSGNINAISMSPDLKTIVSVDSAGSIFFWKMPGFAALKDQADIMLDDTPMRK